MRIGWQILIDPNKGRIFQLQAKYIVFVHPIGVSCTYYTPCFENPYLALITLLITVHQNRFEHSKIWRSDPSDCIPNKHVNKLQYTVEHANSIPSSCCIETIRTACQVIGRASVVSDCNVIIYLRILQPINESNITLWKHTVAANWYSNGFIKPRGLCPAVKRASFNNATWSSWLTNVDNKPNIQ